MELTTNNLSYLPKCCTMHDLAGKHYSRVAETWKLPDLYMKKQKVQKLVLWKDFKIFTYEEYYKWLIINNDGLTSILIRAVRDESEPSHSVITEMARDCNSWNTIIIKFGSWVKYNRNKSYHLSLANLSQAFFLLFSIHSSDRK